MLKSLALTLTLIFACVQTGHAAVQTQNKQSKSPTIGMVTGGMTGTYVRIGKDIADVAKTQDVIIDVKESKGSLDNIKRINSRENAGIGIVQSDLLGYLKRAEDADSRRMSEGLRMLFPFYKEEIHVFANKSVDSFADLKGKKVIVGIEGSGHWLTAMNLLAMEEVSPAELLRLNPADAVVAVLQGRADAMIFVGGKPVKLFKNLEELAKLEAEEYQRLLTQVHFVPLNDPRMLEEYSQASISPEDYSFVTQPVPTVAVTAVLVSYDFSGDNAYHKQRCNALGKMGYALRTHIDTLRRDGHPKWQEVNLDTPAIGLWKKDNCIDSYQPVTAKATQPVTSKAKPKSALEADLLRSITERYKEESTKAE